MKFLILAALVVAFICSGCAGSSHPPHGSRPPGQIPAAAIKVPPETARTPDGATPARPPATFSLTPGAKTIDGQGLHLIEQFEGYSRCAYWDPYGHVWTAGFGQTRGIYGGFCFASLTAAENNLAVSVRREYEWAVHAVSGTFGQHAVDALDSFAFNLGGGIFTGSLRADLARHDYQAAGNIMLQYVHAGGVVLQGLVTRRRLEVALLRTPDAHIASRKDLLARQRTLRRVLLRYGCRARKAAHTPLGPRCLRWYAEGAAVNRALR